MSKRIFWTNRTMAFNSPGAISQNVQGSKHPGAKLDQNVERDQIHSDLR